MRVVLAVLLILLAIPARAEDTDVLRRLMSEPVTLFDWGLAQLDRDIALAAHRALANGSGLGAGGMRTGSIYDWRSRLVTVYVTAATPPEIRTKQHCAAGFRRVVDALTEGAPDGPEAAGWYLASAFRPKANYWAGRFEDIGGKLLDAVRLELSLRPADGDTMAGDTRLMRCTGRLDASPEDLAYEAKS